uniref:Pecanex-like protein n=1 Tax=Schistocephalus solidus TaxID=70667 RepID=A0A183SQL9_SCHSO
LPNAPFPRKVYIARCLSSALQGNPPVKVKMFESGVLKEISQLWHQELHLSSFPNAKFLSDYLLVLGSLLRHFPLSQKVFFAARPDGKDPVGFELLDNTIKSPVWLCRDLHCQKLKLRIFGLLGDLLDERNTTDKTNVQKLRQYSEFDLAAGIRRYGWCREVVALITDSALLTDHSSRERALRAGVQIAQVCSPENLFGNETDSKSLLGVLDSWDAAYDELTRSEERDNSDKGEDLSYFASLLDLLSRFRATVYGTEKSSHPLHSDL